MSKIRAVPSPSTSPPLRSRAESRLSAERAAASGDIPRDPQRLVHELRVHQIELELQNEELRAARLETEATLQRYTQLFEAAPIGYFVVTTDGTIRQVNFSGKRLFGAESWELVGRRLAIFVESEQRTAFANFLLRVATGDERELEECELTLCLGPGQVARRDLRLVGTVLESSPPTLLLVAEDVSLRKRAEETIRDECRRKDLLISKLRGLRKDVQAACSPGDPGTLRGGAEDTEA